MSRTSPRHSLPTLAALALALLAAACGGSTRRGDQVRAEVYELIRHGEFDQALERADELRRELPDDPAVLELHRQATLSWLLARGRQASFDDRPEDALSYFERAREVDPDSALVQKWIEKTDAGIADRWLNVALNLHAADDLEGAIAAYSKALDHVPGHPSALRGIEEALLLANHREGKGVGYYSQGVHALSEYWLRQARWNFSATEKYLPEHERAENRRGQTDDMLAEQKLVVARNLEESGLFAAALRDYEQVLRLDPENAEALAGRDRVAPEAEARRLLNDADMLVLRERYDEAVAMLDRAAPLTQRQKEDVEALRTKIVDQRLETLYRRALNLEKDQRYPEAIVAYEALLEEADYYKDAQARKGTLEEYVQLAERYYEAAANETDPAKRLEYLRAIRGFWIEYRDVADQVVELEAQLPDEEDEGEGAPEVGTR